MVREAGHLGAHQRVGAGVDGGGHEVVEVDGVAEVGGEGAEVHGVVVHGGGVVAVGAVAAHGPFPVAEELGGGGGHAAGDSLHGVAAVLVHRTHAVIVGVLVPGGLDDGFHHYGAGAALRLVDGGPLCGHLSGGLVLLTDGGADLVAVAFQHVVQTGGHGVGVEGAFGGVGQYGEGAVVGGDDHITLAAHVHHIEAGDLLSVGVAGGLRGRVGGLINDGGLGAAE